MKQNIPIGIFCYTFDPVMSKAEKTRSYIIERAAPVFNKKGYAGTSMADIMEVTNLTKGAIYGNFENKDEVASEVFQFNMKSLYGRMKIFMQDKHGAVAQLQGITDYYRTSWKGVFERGGCPLQNASVEADDNLSFLKKEVQASVRNWARSIELIIKGGQTEGVVHKQIDASEYAYMIITILEGGIMLGKIMNNHALLFKALDRIDYMVKTEVLKN
ncbi:MAG: TetR/AcrR family transcriptional regulator [Bacteroidia bacterium]|nr:TetR/AcrR family transcriptional regulator [Bacteroidia bacterium]